MRDGLKIEAEYGMKRVLKRESVIYTDIYGLGQAGFGF